jgi:hypothetical protein
MEKARPSEPEISIEPESRAAGESLYAWAPVSDADRDAVREQLANLLAHPLFCNSKRFPAFLRYSVERVLKGNVEHAKERTIGIEVFGRAADYDTNEDPVVRTTVAEVRKRLQQYYRMPGHETEIRAYFPPGSYVPEFRIAPRSVPTTTVEAIVKEPAVQIPSRARWRWIAAAAVCLILAGAISWRFFSTRNSALNQFWQPVVAGPPVTLCVGHRFPLFRPDGTGANSPVASDELAGERVLFSDMLAAMRIAGLIGRLGNDFRVRQEEDAVLDDLRDGPAVLIGAFDNQWTLKFASQLRFSFVNDGASRFIEDRQNPASRAWRVPGQRFQPGMSEDYALVTRILEPTTGRFIVMAGGIQHYGTRAAGEFLTDASLLEEARRLAPGDWKRKNIQVVLSTKIFGQNSGRPHVLAAYLW